MKKIIFIFGMLFSMNCIGQDTTYFTKSTMWKKKPDLYMSVRTIVTDSVSYNKYWTIEKKRRRKNDRVLSIIGTTLFVGISTLVVGDITHRY